jgi:hypothetical protein
MKPGSLLIPALSALLIISTLVIVSCNKNNSGKPFLKLESISTTVQVNDSMRAEFKFSAGKALSNGTFWSIRTRINQLPLTDSSGEDTLNLQIPAFSASSGEMTFSLPWQGYLSETATQNDTFVFKFFVQTPDSVSSDTVTSPEVVVLYQ